jgi:plastocyanin
MRRAVCAGLAVVAVAGATPAAATVTGKKPKAKTVKVYDNYYGPAKLTVKAGQKVTWVWPADVGDNHDVKTKSIPKGAKRFQSPPYVAAAKWSQTFKKPGKYKLYCTFHETEMTMTITVKKAKHRK